MNSRRSELTRELKEQARQLGFRRAAVCPAAPPPGLDRLQQWIDRGYAGQMHYIEGRREAYSHPDFVLPGARSVVMLLVDYATVEAVSPSPGEGRVARYAWGESDYHDLIHSRLKRLAGLLEQREPGCRARGVVDTAPLMERQFAQLAGLGWIGKNTLLLDKDAGSWFFLAALLTDVELESDQPFASDHCGECRACLDACPTDAFPEPYVLDATRCVSYLTIEFRGPVPRQLRSGMGDWLFGCDVCQEVCPWNRHRPAAEAVFEPVDDANPLPLSELFNLDDDAFRRRFRRTPLWRPKRRGLLRNAAIVLGNQRCAEAVPALCRGLRDAEPLVRGACAWALGQIGDEPSRCALRAAAGVESDAEVAEEIRRGIG